MTGKPNTILRVDAATVLVGTLKVPNGAKVKIEEVQTAADQLFQTGSIVISVPTVGYRSAFVGAVLRSLPGTRIEIHPRRVTLSR